MGVMIDGVWHVEEPAKNDASGAFKRADSVLRSWVTAGGDAGPSGQGGYKAEAGRYHLYIGISCPWAQRTWIFRKLKGLESAVSMSTVLPRRTDAGWVFDNAVDQFRDNLHGKDALHEIYSLGQSDYSGRVTVPVLWDKATGTIVSNESSEIIRMFNSAFDAITGNTDDYCPEDLRDEIDTVNARTYDGLNNGVYRAGFATSQEAYEAAFDQVFETLDWMEERLSRQRYLAGDRLTESDWRAFPTLVRFDVAYVGAFKCNLRRLADYPNLSGYTRELYQHPGVAETVDTDIYKRGYYSISELRNPLGIVPKGPLVDFTAPHGRDALAAAAE